MECANVYGWVKTSLLAFVGVLISGTFGLAGSQGTLGWLTLGAVCLR